VASSPEAALLTTAHREAQARNAAVIAALVARSWQGVTARNLEPFAEQWINAMIPQVMLLRMRSAAISAAYLQAFRALETGVNDGWLPDLSADVPEEKIRTSLWVTGPQAGRRKVNTQRELLRAAGLEIGTPMETALLREAGPQAAASAVRHVTDGGRNTIHDAVRDDRLALGYVRVTKDDPCYFCAMLASRGHVYKGDSFEDSNSLFSGAGVAKAHDDCGCTMEPVYSRSAPLPGRAEEFARIWAQSTPGTSGRDSINAFRRSYEGRS
jgi:hypothetical protein